MCIRDSSRIGRFRNALLVGAKIVQGPAKVIKKKDKNFFNSSQCALINNKNYNSN